MSAVRAVPASARLRGPMLIDGAWGYDDVLEPDRDPGTGEAIGEIARGGPSEVDRAVAAARAAAEAWAAVGPHARAGVLLRASADLEADLEGWAVLATREMGKPLAETRAECARAVEILRFFAGEASRPFGEQYASSSPSTWLFTRRSPVGVVAAITPWNFPAAIPAWKLAPALVFGNAVVLKPATDAALTALRLVRALVDAGLPDGVLNVVLGSGEEVGRALAEHAGVDALTFTGSTEIGRMLLPAAAGRGTAVQLELGGSNPALVCADANLDRALDAVVAGAFASAGQKCTSTRRVLVDTEVYDEFTTRLIARAAELRVGHGLDPATQLGPLVNAAARDRVLAVLERAQGTVHGGERLERHLPPAAAYMRPAVVTDLAADAELAREEVFGPVVGVWEVCGPDEAAQLAGATEYGLSAAIFTADLDRAKEFVDRIGAGIVHVNSQTAGAEPHVPFGGFGASGYGPHEQGRDAIEFFTRRRTIYLDPASG